MMDPDEVRKVADRADEAIFNAIGALELLDDLNPALNVAHAHAQIAVAEQLRALRLALVDAIDRAGREARKR